MKSWNYMIKGSQCRRLFIHYSPPNQKQICSAKLSEFLCQI